MNQLLVIGATGSVGRLVVARALADETSVRVLVRDQRRAEKLLGSDNIEFVVGDATDPDVMAKAVDGVQKIILTHAAHQPREALEAVDYGIVKLVLTAVSGRKVRIALMTSFGVTAPEQPQNQNLGILDLKRRSERLLRVSGHDYTIVRPGWFDSNADDERSIVFLQGDKLRSGRPEAGRIARDEIARVLVESLDTPSANKKTLELIAEPGTEQEDLTLLFDRLLPDVAGSSDGALDPDTLPISAEPEPFVSDLRTISATASA